MIETWLESLLKLIGTCVPASSNLGGQAGKKKTGLHKAPLLNMQRSPHHIAWPRRRRARWCEPHRSMTVCRTNIAIDEPALELRSSQRELAGEVLEAHEPILVAMRGALPAHDAGRIASPYHIQWLRSA